MSLLLGDRKGFDIIEAPDEVSFREAFDGITPATAYFSSALGRTAYYPMKGDSESKEHIIIVHGICTPAVGMYNLAQEILKLRPTASILLYDIWGHGLSSTPDIPHTIDLFVEQLRGLMLHCKLDRVRLAGFSFGGCISAAFTAAHSKMVQSLTLIAPGGMLRLKEMSIKIQNAVLQKDPKHLDDESVKEAIFVDFLEGGNNTIIQADLASFWYKLPFQDGHSIKGLQIDWRDK